MKKLVKRNLFLISKNFYLCIFYILTIVTMLFLKEDAFTFLVFFIPAMTSISASAIEKFDSKNYKITFSMPVIRNEFANTKAVTLLLLVGVNAAVSLITYIIAVLSGKVEILPFSLLVLGLSFSYLLSMLGGGLALTAGDKRPNYIYIILFIIIFDNMNIPSFVLGNDILIYLISVIFLAIGRTVYVIAKENILRICLEMEL